MSSHVYCVCSCHAKVHSKLPAARLSCSALSHQSRNDPPALSVTSAGVTTPSQGGLAPTTSPQAQPSGPTSPMLSSHPRAKHSVPSLTRIYSPPPKHLEGSRISVGHPSLWLGRQGTVGNGLRHIDAAMRGLSGQLSLPCGL